MRNMAKRWLSGAAPFLLWAAMLMVLPGCVTNPSTGRSQLILFNAEEVNAMGNAAMPELVQEYGGEVESARLRRYVSQIGHSMAQLTEAEYPALEWEFTVLDSDVINAFALPGGKVFISRALIERMENEAQLAGVLGHEIGHVTARHVDERLSQAMVLQGVAVGASTALEGGDSGWGQVVPLLVGIGGQGYLLKFGRDQELEADVQGLKYMTLAGYDPRALLDVMQILKSSSQGGGPPEFLSTHPAPDRRLAQIEQIIDDEYGHTRNDPSYGLHADRFRREALSQLGAAGGSGERRPLAGH